MQVDFDEKIDRTHTNSLKWDSFYVVEGALVLKGRVQLPFYEGEPKCHAGTSLITNEEVKVEDSRD